jgi:hypothetical protein
MGTDYRTRLSLGSGGLTFFGTGIITLVKHRCVAIRSSEVMLFRFFQIDYSKTSEAP